MLSALRDKWCGWLYAGLLTDLIRILKCLLSHHYVVIHRVQSAAQDANAQHDIHNFAVCMYISVWYICISPCEQLQASMHEAVKGEFLLFDTAAVLSACCLHSLRSQGCPISWWWLPPKWQVMRRHRVWSNLMQRLPVTLATCSLHWHEFIAQSSGEMCHMGMELIGLIKGM